MARRAKRRKPARFGRPTQTSTRSNPVDAPKPASTAARAPVTLPPDVDTEILEIFFEEAEELLEAIDQSVHEWRAAPDNQVHLEVLLRCLHTLKGGARLAGLTGLGDDAHAFESMLVGVQNDALTAGFFDAMQTRHDEILVSVLAFRAAASGSAQSAPVAPRGAARCPDACAGDRGATECRAASAHAPQTGRQGG